MKLSHIKTNIPDNKLRSCLARLLSQKKQGDIVAGRILALFADSSDSNIRNVYETVICEEKYCHGKHTNASLQVSGVEKGHEARGDQEGEKPNNVQVSKEVKKYIEAVIAEVTDEDEDDSQREFYSEEDRRDIAPLLKKYLQPGDNDSVRKALEIVILDHKASTSYFQRRLKIGYNRAAEIADLFEERGIIGPDTGSGKPREILIFDSIEEEIEEPPQYLGNPQIFRSSMLISPPKEEQELSFNDFPKLKPRLPQQKNEPPQSTTEESTPKAFSIKSRYSALFWITLGSCIVVFNLNESVWGYTLGFCFILLGYFDFYAKLSEKYGNKIKTKMSEYKNKLREDRLTAAKKSKDKEILHKLSMSDDEEIRKNVAKNIFTNHSDLILLSRDKSSEVRKNVADNPTIHLNMLMSLMEDEDEEVKNTAKKNYSEYVQDLTDTFDAGKDFINEWK